MVAGRPKEYDLVELAQDLIEWSKQSDALNLIGFSSPRDFSVTQLPQWADIDKQFSKALSKAKENIAHNRFKAANRNEMVPAFYTRTEGMYDPLYHKYDRDNKKFESDLRKQEEGTKQTTYNITVPNGLSAGANISTSPVSDTNNNSSK